MHGRRMRWARPVLITIALVAASGVAADGGHADPRPHGYLALGDSVPFGFNPLIDKRDPTKFIGYPEDAATQLGMALTNASCPGEASGGFISLTGADNSCRPFRAAFPLHVSYQGSQLDFALASLRSHPRTTLVSLTLGANDLFVCQKTTRDHCASPVEVAATLATYERNLTTILSAIRAVYRQQLVTLTYYSIDDRDPATTRTVAALNAVIATVTARFDGEVANGFTAFARAAARDGDNCTAGLLRKYPDDTCDIHPSATGARLLAGALVAAVHRRASRRTTSKDGHSWSVRLEPSWLTWACAERACSRERTSSGV
ncbi:MAG: SGNH/GDSL hydrolase family protein [Pseudonocardiaceae bacterium]